MLQKSTQPGPSLQSKIRLKRNGLRVKNKKEAELVVFHKGHSTRLIFGCQILVTFAFVDKIIPKFKRDF